LRRLDGGDKLARFGSRAKDWQRMSETVKAIVGAVAVFFLGTGLAVWTIYELRTGKANCWPWQTKNKRSGWWLLRTEQPVVYWFRIALSTVASFMMYALYMMGLFAKHQ
jgi:hypothetical protein